MTGSVGLRHYRVANDAALYLQIAKFAGVARNFISSFVLLMQSSPLCWPTLKLPCSSSLLKGSKKVAKREEKGSKKNATQLRHRYMRGVTEFILKN